MKRLLVIRGGAVGDFIVTLPVFAALRQMVPQATIEVLGHSSRAVLARHPYYASHISDLEGWDMHRLLSPTLTLSDPFCAYLGSFDRILTYLQVPDDVLVHNLRQYCPGGVLSGTPHPPSGMHVTDHLLQALGEAIPASVSRVPKVYLEPEAESAATRFWAQTGLPQEGVIAVHPGSGGRHKLWPLEGWYEVMDWVAQQGMTGLLISGPAEHDGDLRRELNRLSAVHSSAWAWTSDLTLPQLAAVLARCRVVVSHDSGVAHLAAAVGTPVLALFGPTDPLSWGPRSMTACVLQPSPPQPLTLETLPPAVVTDTLHAVWNGTFPFDPAESPCTIVRVPFSASKAPV